VAQLFSLGVNMSFPDRQYEVFVILGDPAAQPTWTELRWKLISDILDPLVQKARDRAAVRSSQMRKGAGSPNQRSISFGRIGWNAQGHKKWLHTSPESDGNEFIDTEVWAPSWTACEREGRAPDVYVAVRNAQSTPTERVTFNPIFILAVALDADGRVVSSARASAEALSAALGSVLRARWVRPWGIRMGGIGFTNAIGDLSTVGLFKPGPRHQQPPSVDMLEGSWEVF
jgi:hypothetical protein